MAKKITLEIMKIGKGAPFIYIFSKQGRKLAVITGLTSLVKARKLAKALYKEKLQVKDRTIPKVK